MPEEVAPQKAKNSVFRGVCDNIFTISISIRNEEKNMEMTSLNGISNAISLASITNLTSRLAVKKMFEKRKMILLNELKRLKLSIEISRATHTLETTCKCLHEK